MYQVDVLIQGFPGRSVCHGGLGWSTITLMRSKDRVILLDVGAFGVRKPLAKQLKIHGVDPSDVTDVILTHAHYDHSINFTLFPNATIWIGDVELNWAANEPPGFNPLPELYVRELVQSSRLKRIRDGDRFLPGFVALASPGHTPGHLIFVMDGNEVPVVFTGDAAKNRAELLSLDVGDTEDHEESIETLKLIWKCWRAKPGTLLIPGHDLTMVLDAQGQPQYIGKREASIVAWFSETLTEATTFDLCAKH